MTYFILSFFILMVVVAFFGHYVKHQSAEQHECTVSSVNVTFGEKKATITWSLSHNRTISRTKSVTKMEKLLNKYLVGETYNCFVNDKHVYWKDPNIGPFMGYIIGLLICLGQCALSISILVYVSKHLANEESLPLEYTVIYRERVY